jgi:hypothetical protein
MLPDLPSVPAAYRGKPYRISRLLGDGDSNAKLAKTNDASLAYRTYGLSLAPADSSGFQLCVSSSPGCREACLFRQGRGKWDITMVARIAKAVAFVKHRHWFGQQLHSDVAAAVRQARRAGLIAAFRLNVVSDVPWENVFGGLFDDFPEAIFYDYTKHLKRAIRFARGDRPPNYHLTFSRSESNDADCEAVLQAGGNVAVVFRKKPLPATWWGFPVVDGDATDLRFLDPPKVVVGLTAKGDGKDDESGFVVDVGGRQPLLLLK